MIVDELPAGPFMEIWTALFPAHPIRILAKVRSVRLGRSPLCAPDVAGSIIAGQRTVGCNMLGPMRIQKKHGAAAYCRAAPYLPQAVQTTCCTQV